MPADPGPTLSIRDAARVDLPGIVAIYNACAAERRAGADREPIAVASRIAWWERHRRDRHPLWVAADALRVHAWLSVRPFDGHPAAHPGTVELSVYVAPRRQRAGLGRKLLDLAVESAPRLGLSTLVACIDGRNEASQALFAACGFERWARLPRDPLLDGVRGDVVLVGLHVPA